MVQHAEVSVWWKAADPMGGKDVRAFEGFHTLSSRVRQMHPLFAGFAESQMLLSDSSWSQCNGMLCLWKASKAFFIQIIDSDQQIWEVMTKRWGWVLCVEISLHRVVEWLCVGCDLYKLACRGFPFSWSHITLLIVWSDVPSYHSPPPSWIIHWTSPSDLSVHEGNIWSELKSLVWWPRAA